MFPQSAGLYLRQDADGAGAYQKAVDGDTGELEENARARSAKLRAIEKL
jgi:16S rRNA C1402 N4-methylase RsmH